ncbi:MAG: DUF4058 family protein [Anaerolineae bacterium]|nr:DUF4058 family protein [Anaerolineae bacterium]
MPTPFPGMDPYLERPSLWTNVHTSLIIALRDDLAPRLRPKYYVAVEERSVRLGPDELAFAVRPDVAIVRSAPGQTTEAASVVGPSVLTVELPMAETIREVFLEMREVGTDRVVTVVEILSPTNKLPGPGRRDYEQKRLNLLGTLTHLVEIDLLRAGPPMPMLGYTEPSDYRILVSRAERRPQADLIAFSVRQPIPTFRLPLQPGDTEPEVDLTALLHGLYDRAGYDLRLNYRTAAEPPLTGEDAVWADALLRRAAIR